jgi:hypothetical protein
LNVGYVGKNRWEKKYYVFEILNPSLIIRVLSTLNKPLNMVPTWLVVFPPRRLVKLISVFPFSVLSVR